MQIKNVYTSAACNQAPHSADWGNNGTILFAACNAVAIFNPKYHGSAKITHIFAQHTKRVTVVKWVACRSGAPETHFLSGSDDGLAIFWDISNPEKEKHLVLQGHEGAVNCLEGIYVQDKLIVATSSADATIKLWYKLPKESEITCYQTICLENRFCLTLKFTTFPKTNQLMMACTGESELISLWMGTPCLPLELAHGLPGHEDWVRALDFVHFEGDLLLASGSQDNFVRLWRISYEITEKVNDSSKVNSTDIGEENWSIRIKEAIPESILYGHEGWVYSVQWNLSDKGLQLLSASMDKSIIVWQKTDCGVWMEKVRLGEVGGNSLGFYGAKFLSDGKCIMAHGFQGGFHIWKQSDKDANSWTPSIIVGGHFREVRDIDWAPDGSFLLSVSADQTTRLHAPWIRKGASDITWHELARPQIHGYDMQTVAVISRTEFASGAEEKIVRVFQATANFIENFSRITRCNDKLDDRTNLKDLPKGASVPSLGLSNKAVYTIEEPPKEKHTKDEYPEYYFAPVTLSGPPQEETLMQNTLWPEIQKLYGHGFEIYSLAVSPDKSILASACRATSVQHACIILWDTTTWKQVQKLPSHNLTITQMKFSPDSKYLLSVSRDRRWTLFEALCGLDDDLKSCYSSVATTDKTNGIHTRIIWSCDWSHDSKLFATSSRDGKVVTWKQSNDLTMSSLGSWKEAARLDLKSSSITAVAFADKMYDKKSYLVAIGLEIGTIQLYASREQFQLLYSMDNSMAHHLTVNKLQFRPVVNGFQLASCGDDHLVRIYGIRP